MTRLGASGVHLSVSVRSAGSADCRYLQVGRPAEWGDFDGTAFGSA